MNGRFFLAPRRPHAVLEEVRADEQSAVAGALRAALRDAIGGDAGAAARMLPAVAGPEFYDVLARENAARAEDWVEMARVQRQFHEAEPAFDVRTRAYSESMRLTLHAATVMALPTVEDLSSDRHFFEAFLEMHVTAFRENGAWFGNMHVAWCGALAVVGATRISMLAHAADLRDGVDVVDRTAQRAAELVRVARRTVIAARGR